MLTPTITGKAKRQRGFFPMSEANVVYCFVRHFALQANKLKLQKRIKGSELF
jgi:hypothetical protein